LTLLAAIQTLTSLDQDSARLARNLTAAIVYDRQLAAIPAGGHRNIADSLDVMYHQYDGTVAVIRAAASVTDIPIMVAHTAVAVRILARMGVGERFFEITQEFPYRDISSALADAPTSVGGGWRDSLDARLTALVLGEDAEWPPTLSAAEREGRRRGIIMGMQWVLGIYHAVGHPAPPIIAHAYLNTPDSAYTQTPREQRFNDGAVHVIAMGRRLEPRLAALQRVHDMFPTVHVAFLTETVGHSDVDILSPEAEVAWLASYYGGVRRFTVPIAVWAGPKVAGPERSLVPQPSPLETSYEPAMAYVMVIDAHGILRAYEPVRSRVDERRLVRRIRRVLDTSSVH